MRKVLFTLKTQTHELNMSVNTQLFNRKLHPLLQQQSDRLSSVYTVHILNVCTCEEMKFNVNTLCCLVWKCTSQLLVLGK